MNSTKANKEILIKIGKELGVFNDFTLKIALSDKATGEDLLALMNADNFKKNVIAAAVNKKTSTKK